MPERSIISEILSQRAIIFEALYGALGVALVILLILRGDSYHREP